MRAQNAKRLWPVPAALAVMAVAALLAFGLVVTNGAQPAAAQDGADCEITVSAQTLTLPDACDAMGGTATVKISSLSTATDDQNVYVLIDDPNGSIRAYPQNTSDTATATLGRYTYVLAVVPEPALDANGVRQAGSVTITVDGDIRLWTDPPNATFAGVTTAIQDASNNERAVSDGGSRLDIIFLGDPVIGEDLDSDHNTAVDDVSTIQCRVTDDDDNEIVSEVESLPCPDGQEAISDNPDGTTGDPTIESRSKLVVHRTALTDTADTVEEGVLQLLDGSTLDVVMMDAQDVVTIHAVIEDEERNALVDTEVSFSATPMPSGILSASALSDTEDAEAFGTTDRITGLAGTDAVATFSIDDLSDAAAEGAYRVIVEVMVGDLSLGTVNIFKPAEPTKILAGIFSAECFTPGGTADDPDYEAAKFSMTNPGCEELGMSSRFGANEMFFVKAHLETSSTTKSGTVTTLTPNWPTKMGTCSVTSTSSPSTTLSQRTIRTIRRALGCSPLTRRPPSSTT